MLAHIIVHVSVATFTNRVYFYLSALISPHGKVL